MRRTLRPRSLAALAASAVAAPARRPTTLRRSGARTGASRPRPRWPRRRSPTSCSTWSARRIALMARGMVLFEVADPGAGVWGRRLAIGPTAVGAARRARAAGDRPGEEKSRRRSTSSSSSWSTCPPRYRLRLAGDVDDRGRARSPRGAGRSGASASSIWRWRLTRPLVTLRQRRERHETTTVLPGAASPEDAQRLYWSFFEGLDGILIPPARTLESAAVPFGKGGQRGIRWTWRLAARRRVR